MSQFARFFDVTFLAIISLASSAVFGQATETPFSVRGDVSGNWANQDFESQGVQIEIVDKRRAVVAWFTYGAAGEPLWLFGTGDVDGSSIAVDMLALNNGIFPGFDPAGQDVLQEEWGEVVIQFEDCQNAEMTWDAIDSATPDGSMQLYRVTEIEGLGCGTSEVFEREVRFSLDASAGQWEPFFFDFHVYQDDQIERVATWSQLPEPLAHRNGLKIGGTNASDDLAMQFKSVIAGLAPSTEYRVVQELTFATNVPAGCLGIGGSPGDSVYMHLGAVDTEPEVIEDTRPGTGEEPFYYLNISPARGPFDGEDAVSVGNLANFQDCETVGGIEGQWQLKTISSEGSGFVAQADSEGRLWVFGGSDSGYEGRTTYYVTDWVVKLSPVESDAQ